MRGGSDRLASGGSDGGGLEVARVGSLSLSLSHSFGLVCMSVRKVEID